jgi:hypothetical protein
MEAKQWVINSKLLTELPGAGVFQCVAKDLNGFVFFGCSFSVDADN